jgi:DNA-binding CsgD family transcriptional regulator
VTRLDLVGRANDLDELARAWSRVTERRTGALAVVTGAAGVGKTRLVGAAVAGLQPGPATVLAGAARIHSPAPYDWLAGILCGRDLSALTAPADALAWLAQDPDLPRERFAPDALLRIAVRVVRELIGDGPAVLTVDDLHALDPASLNLVAELAAADLPALMLVTSRPAVDAVSPALVARTLSRLSGAPSASRVHLGPLRLADTARALDSLQPGLDSAVVKAIHQRCGGNPYQLIELVATAGGDLNAAVRPAMAVDLISDLTARERDVLACLAKGMSNKEVARCLGISTRTVGVHVSNVLRKTRSSSRVDAAVLAVQARAVI